MGWHYPAGPAGRHPSPSRPAGRTRPRGPEPLYTVRRDLVGHGALDVTGGRSPLGLAGPPLWGGDVPPGPGAGGDELRARVALGPRGPRWGARGFPDRTRAGGDVTALRPA